MPPPPTGHTVSAVTCGAVLHPHEVLMITRMLSFDLLVRRCSCGQFLTGRTRRELSYAFYDHIR